LVGALKVGEDTGPGAAAMKRKRYRREFKDEACKLVMLQGYSMAEAARELGLVPQTLAEWLKARGYQASVEHQCSPESDDPVVLKATIRQLEKQLRRSEMEKEILKKATAFFASLNP
jgi:transposase